MERTVGSIKRIAEAWHCFFKRYSKIDQHLARHKYNGACLSSPLPFYAVK